MNRLRYFMFVMTVIGVLILSAVQIVPVRADDGTPPPLVETPVEVAPPVEELVEANPTEEVPTETPVIVEETAAPQSTEDSVSDLLASIPEGTDVIVTNGEGEVLSLASTEAAEVIDTNDPIWCPTGVAPNPGVGGCTTTQTAFNGGLLGLLSGKTVNGTIWILGSYQGTVSTPSTAIEGGGIVIDGGILGTTANFALTIKGGWTGTTAGAVNTLDPSEFNVSFSIVGWNGDVTLSNILIQNVVQGDVTNNSALNIETTKKIVLTNVQVNNNTDPGAGTVNGAHLDSDDGNPLTVGDVTITNSKFNGNEVDGLNVITDGSITLSGVIANGNTGGNGVTLNNIAAAPVAKNVTLTTGMFEFNDNGDTGLVIWSKGAITLQDITANHNDTDGAYLDNLAGTGNVTLTGTNIFSENVNGGLVVWSKGAISASNLIANANDGLWGANLHNNAAAGSMPITLTGSNEFKFNGGGLRIQSNGAITLNNIVASNNHNYNGVWLVNDSSTVNSSVTLTGTNIFNDNNYGGINIYSKGIISLNNVKANGNGFGAGSGFGAELYNFASGTPKAVTISVSGGNPDSLFNNNYSGGLQVYSLGAITVTGIVAADNANGNGVTLKNDYLGALGGITILGWGGSFSNNGGGYGLSAYSLGSITAPHLYAWSNSSYGVLLDNHNGIGTVTLSGYSGFGNNNGDGLIIRSARAIALNDVYGNSNNGSGVVLDNRYSGTALPQNVTLTGTSHDFNNNTADGLRIDSYGSISIAHLDTYNNIGFGVILDNCQQSVPGTCATITAKPVTLTGDNTFRWSGLSGLDITSKGVITINNVIASNNGFFGVYLDNQMTGSVGTVSVTNTPTYWPEFSFNGFDGLKIHSNGNITVIDLDALGNGTAQDPLWGHGVYLNNDGGTGNIVLGTARAGWYNGFGENFLSGLEIYSNGTVTLSRISAGGNGIDNTIDPIYGYGVKIDNTNIGLLPKTVTLLGTNFFSDNASGGLYVTSHGAITLSNITVDFNGHRASGGDGVNLQNYNAATPQPVTLSGVNELTSNYNNGLQVISKGAITISNITSSYNGDGAELYNDINPLSPQNVTLTGFNEFINNYNNGLEIVTYGAIVLNNITANENGLPSIGDSDNGFGAFLNNAGGLLVRPVTLNGYNGFWSNLDGGLEIHTLGAIVLNNVGADENSFGILLDNNEPGAVGGVTINGGVYTSGNATYGMDITTKGAILITVPDAYVSGNGSYGWSLNNNFSGAVGGITLTSPNVDWAFDFSNNGSYGLWAQSLGAIKFTGLDASDNGDWGARLENNFPGSVGTITITAPVLGNNDFSGNVGTGLLVYSNRAITIGTLGANNNGLAGAVLDNTYSGSGSPQNVILTGSNDFTMNGDTGLVVVSYGAITINNLYASDNGQYNFWADDQIPQEPTNPYGYGAYLDNYTGAVTPKDITLTGINDFYFNYQGGLWITSLGTIKLNEVTASGNGGSGAHLDNQWGFASFGITLTGYNLFEGNGDQGLEIYSNGAVSLNNVSAVWNVNDGLFVSTYNDFSPVSKVNITGSNYFNGNGSNGLVIYSDTTITLNNITANGNGVNGANLNNYDAWGLPEYWTLSSSIKITGANTFSGNGETGLFFRTYGLADISKLTADNNDFDAFYTGGSGVVGYSNNSSITITCGSMTRNGTYGWSLDAFTLVTLKGVFAIGNFVQNTNGDIPVVVRTCPLP